MTADTKQAPVTDQLSALRAHLPYATTPTSVPGVLTNPPLPKDFDPRHASAHALLQHGILWRRPKEGDPAVMHRAWDHAFSKPWLPENHVVPVMQTHPEVRHHRVRNPTTSGSTNPIATTANWAGGVLNGNWGLVTGNWVVPTVTKPREHAGVRDRWQCSTWIGIDGDFFSDDVLQAGTTQWVDSGGGAHYYAWFEWYCGLSKVELSDTTPCNFALVSDSPAELLGVKNVYLAFRGENDHLDILFASNYGNGGAFGNKLTSSETTGQGPALALHEGVIYVAWTGTTNQRLNVAQVTLQGTRLGLQGKVTLSPTSSTGPALASLGGVLYLAWQDANHFLNIASSTDGGRSFMITFTSDEASPHAPALAVHNGQLFIAWQRKADNRLRIGTLTITNNAVSGIASVVTVAAETIRIGPTIASNGSVLFVAWKAASNDHLHVIQSTDGGQTFTGEYVSPEQSPSSPTLTLHDGQMFIGWRGESDNLNVSVLGYRGGAIQGFTPAPYLLETEITNFPVHPGDEIVCTVLYTNDLSAGYIALGNMTTGKYFSITLQPQPAAVMNGGSIEWILEAPQIEGQHTVLPNFTPVTFAGAFGCGPNFSIGDPSNGSTYLLVNAAHHIVTQVNVASDSVAIQFVG